MKLSEKTQNQIFKRFPKVIIILVIFGVVCWGLGQCGLFSNLENITKAWHKNKILSEMESVSDEDFYNKKSTPGSCRWEELQSEEKIVWHEKKIKYYKFDLDLIDGDQEKINNHAIGDSK